jgi:hypothetical protein
MGLATLSLLEHDVRLTLDVWVRLWHLEERLEEVLEGKVQCLGREVTAGREEQL